MLPGKRPQAEPRTPARTGVPVQRLQTEGRSWCTKVARGSVEEQTYSCTLISKEQPGLAVTGTTWTSFLTCARMHGRSAEAIKGTRCLMAFSNWQRRHFQKNLVVPKPLGEGSVGNGECPNPCTFGILGCTSLSICFFLCEIGQILNRP